MPATRSIFSVVHTESSLGWGGQERRIVFEMERFRDLGHRVRLAAAPRSEIARRARQRGIEVREYSFERSRWPRELPQLRQMLREFSPEVLATHSSRDGWMAGLAGAWAGVPLRLKYRHVSVPVGAGPLNWWNYRGLHHGVVTTSAQIADSIREKFRLPPERVSVIPTGVDLEKFDPNGARLDLKRELKIPNDSRLLGIVSVLRSWKGHVHLIRAVAALNRPDVYLAIIGEGGQRENLENLVVDLGLEQRIFFLGERDAAGALRGLDLLVLPSTQKEGIPQIVLQAFASGVPVVGSDIDGIREVLTEERGWLALPGDSQALADVLAQALDQPAESQKRAAAALEYARVAHSAER
ncbi:MAG: glycosyltransferase, partial [Verrucomicrobiae bacterium]|nr:glycosyltransferase [Verrucomicrobiae bacterium]